MPVPGLPAARSLSAGLGFTCATTVDGRAFCWGGDDKGQLGDGGGADRPAPGPVAGLTQVVTTAAGHDAACALLGSGEIWCWGELGDSGRALRAVTGLPGAALDVVVGEGTACALLATGEVWCWGTAGAATSRSISSAVSVAMIGDSPCAALADGTLTCVGAPPAPALSVSGGTVGACALLSDGTVWCWGGPPFAGNPGPVPEAKGAAAVSAGHYFACVVMATGEVRCWGDNWSGQLGDGTNAARSSPAPVVGLPGPATQVTASLGGYVLEEGCGKGATPSE